MKILVISSIYPGQDVPQVFTPVVHYFTRQWVKMGYDIRVIHTSNYFPIFYYWAPSFLRKYITNNKGFALPEKRLNKELDFVIDNVKVHRIPMLKIIPGRMFADKVIQHTTTSIITYLNKENFRPDYIVGHWVIPQAQLLYYLKQKYKCPTILTLHDSGEQLKICKNVNKLIDTVDVWGYRSEKIKSIFETKYGKKPFSFRCYSGIPSSFCDNTVKRTWKKIHKFIYVGMLIKRKHPDKIIQAINYVYKDDDYNIDIIGEGQMSTELEQLAKRLKCRNKINFLGRINRECIKARLDLSDVFIMISENEVFGLVYLEAMARGCIVIASKNEGMQGIIIDGVNGFLCNAGDTDDLENIIKRIIAMSPVELNNISMKAQQTAYAMTDYKVAKIYIKNIMELGDSSKKMEESLPYKQSKKSPLILMSKHSIAF